MKGVSIRYSVDTMIKLGRTISYISRTLRIDRKTVRKTREEIKANGGAVIQPAIKKVSMLDSYPNFFVKEALKYAFLRTFGIMRPLHNKQIHRRLRLGEI